MTSKNSHKTIPEDIALKICTNIRQEKPVRIFSQCWGCLKYSKEDTKKMCFYDPPKNRGCNKINKRFDKQ
jgi:hypothetical protein